MSISDVREVPTLPVPLARSSPLLMQFTHAERKVLSYIFDGLSAKEVARHLGISPRTVEDHRLNMMKKADVHHITHVVAKVAIELIGKDTLEALINDPFKSKVN